MACVLVVPSMGTVPGVGTGGCRMAVMRMRAFRLGPGDVPASARELRVLGIAGLCGGLHGRLIRVRSRRAAVVVSVCVPVVHEVPVVNRAARREPAGRSCC